jgi:hypothetical protein
MHRRGSDSHPPGSLRLCRSCRGRPHYRTRLSADRAGRGRAARPSWRRARIPWAVSAGGRARRECGSAPVMRPHQTRVPANDLRGCSIRARVRVGVALGDSSLRHAIVRLIASTACNRKPRRKPLSAGVETTHTYAQRTDSGRKADWSERVPFGRPLRSDTGSVQRTALAMCHPADRRISPSASRGP